MVVGHRHNTPEVHGSENTVHLRIYTAWDELAELHPAWDRLLQHCTRPTIFSTPEWLGAWWKAYGQKKQLVTLVFSSLSGEVIGLAPLYLETLYGGIRRLRLVGDGTQDSDNLDLIFRAEHEEKCTQAFLTWMASDEAVWDLCELNTLPGDSMNARCLLRGLQARRWIHQVYQRPNSAVNLPDNWALYLEQLATEDARGIERYMRRLYRHYDVRMYKCMAEDRLQACLETLFDLHTKRWNAQGESGSFAQPGRKQFYAEMSRAFLRRGWLEFWLLELDEKVVAAEFDFRYRDTACLLQSGLDPQHYADRAGNVLKAHVIRQLITDGIHRYDFLGGAEPYKQRWGAQPGIYRDIHFVANSFSKAHLYMRLRDSLHLRERANAAASRFRAYSPTGYRVLRHAKNSLRDVFRPSDHAPAARI